MRGVLAALGPRPWPVPCGLGEAGAVPGACLRASVWHRPASTCRALLFQQFAEGPLQGPVPCCPGCPGRPGHWALVCKGSTATARTAPTQPFPLAWTLASFLLLCPSFNCLSCLQNGSKWINTWIVQTPVRGEGGVSTSNPTPAGPLSS